MSLTQSDNPSTIQQPLVPPGVSLRLRILVVTSCLWTVLVFLVALNINTDRYGEIDWIGLINGSTIFGVIPIGVAWGIVWILAARRK